MKPNLTWYGGQKQRHYPAECEAEASGAVSFVWFFHEDFPFFSFLRAFKRVFFGGPSKKTPRTPPYQVPTLSGESLLIF